MPRPRSASSVGWSSRWKPTTRHSKSARTFPASSRVEVEAHWGENPLNTEYLFEKMYRSTVAFGRKGAVMAAISAVDIALWDIKARPLAKRYWFLGGPPDRRPASTAAVQDLDQDRYPHQFRRHQHPRADRSRVAGRFRQVQRVNVDRHVADVPRSRARR